MTKAEKILNKCEHILDDYDADYRGGYVDVIDGTTYIVFKYYGGKHDTIDRNDDSWDEMYELEGVADVGYGSGYGMGNTKYEDMLLIELEDGLNESKKSARKSIKESADDINNTAYFDRVAGELHSWYVCYVEDYERKYEYGFKNEKECINWIKKNGFDLNPSMIESKNSTRKSIKEERYNVELSDYSGSIVDEETFDKKSDAIQWAKDNGRNCYARIWDNEEGKTVKEWKVKSIKESVPFTKITWYDDFLSQEMANLIRDKFDVSVSYFSDFDEGVYGIRIKTSDYNSKILNFIKKKVGDVSVLEESKELARKSIKESADDIITVKEFCFWGHSGNIVEIWTIDGVLCDSFEVRNVGKSEYKNYEIHGWDCAKNTVIIYIKI